MIQLKKVFDAQTFECPKEVEDDVRKVWADNEFGNDYYYLSTSIEALEEEGNGDYKHLVAHLRNEGLKDDEEILLHWWW